MLKQINNFNGGYIKASQEAYALLVKGGYRSTEIKYSIDCSYIEIIEDRIFYTNYIEAIINLEKQFYINNGTLSWDKPEKRCDFHGSHVKDCACEPTQINSMEDLNELPTTGEENDRRLDSSISSSNDIIHNANTDISSIISIKDDKGKVYEFEKPEFECELLKVLIEKQSNKIIIGCVRTTDDYWISASWELDGFACLGNDKSPEHNLTPIKPKCFIKTVQYYNDNTYEMFIVEQEFVSEDEFEKAIKNTVELREIR